MHRGTVAQRLAEFIAWCAVAGVGMVMLTQALGWNGTPLVASLQSLTPYGLPLVAGAAGVALYVRRHALGAVAAIVGFSVLALSIPLVIAPDQASPRPGAVGLRIAAVNLLYSNVRSADVAEQLALLDTDVIVFSEYTPEHHAVLTAHPLADDFPHQINRDGLFAGGMAVWSRFPVVENERPQTVNRTIDAVVDAPDGDVLVYAVHPPTPIFDIDEWQRDLGLIGERAAATDEPLVVIGDFNASYWHPVFRDLIDLGLTDAHMANGAGWSTSWPTDSVVPPFVRLDHALTANGLVSTDVDDFRVPGSDHAGFVVTVAPSN